MRKIQCKWLTGSFLLFSMGVYLGISSFSISGLIGVLCLNFIIFAVIETSLCNMGLLKNENKKGCIMLAVSVCYLMLSISNKNFSGKLIVLGITTGFLLLILTWMMLVNVERNSDKLIFVFVIFGFLMVALYIWQNVGCFTADSYSYYEISETIGKEFGKVGTIRQYVMRTDYNISFPYFYPFCIFVINKITGLGRYSGVLFNVYIMMLTYLLFFYISKKLVNKYWCGGIAVFLLSTNTSYLEEVCAARSIPLAMLFSLVAFYLIASIYSCKKENKIIPFIVGISIGLLISTRFDGLVMVAYCTILIVICNRNRIWNFISYMVGLAIAASPWMIYSIGHFSKLWISDNYGTAFLVYTSIPTRIIVPGDETLTLFNAPKVWLYELSSKIFTVVNSLMHCSYMADICILVCIILIIKGLIHKNIKHNIKVVLSITTIFYVGKTCMYILVGYDDSRYHIETVIFLAFIFMMVVENIGIVIKNKRFVMAIIFVELMLTVWSFRYVGYGVLFHGYSDALSKIEVAPEWVTELNNELCENITDMSSDILVLGFNGYVFGGWTDWRIYAAPKTNQWDKLEYAINNYMDVEYIVTTKEYGNEEILEELNHKYNRTELTNYYLFDLGVVKQ
jgi:hypothetical protein